MQILLEHLLLLLVKCLQRIICLNSVVLWLFGDYFGCSCFSCWARVQLALRLCGSYLSVNGWGFFCLGCGELCCLTVIIIGQNELLMALWRLDDWFFIFLTIRWSVLRITDIADLLLVIASHDQIIIKMVRFLTIFIIFIIFVLVGVMVLLDLTQTWVAMNPQVWTTILYYGCLGFIVLRVDRAWAKGLRWKALLTSLDRLWTRSMWLVGLRFSYWVELRLTDLAFFISEWSQLHLLDYALYVAASIVTTHRFGALCLRAITTVLALGRRELIESEAYSGRILLLRG